MFYRLRNLNNKYASFYSPKVGCHNNRGTTLVEILVAMSIFGIVVMGIAEFFRNTEKMKRKLYVKTVMERISRDIHYKIKNPFSIYLSLLDQENTNLMTCVYGTGANCEYTNPATSSGFRLSYRNSLTSTDYAAAPTSGTDEEVSELGVCYDTNGAFCDCGESSEEKTTPCVFAAETYFYVSCPSEDGSLKCNDGATSVHVAYRVKQIEGTLRRFGRKVKDLPHREFYVHHSAKSIFNPRFNSECNTGAVVIGFGPKGRALCDCVGEYEYAGYDNNRGPICKKPSDLQYECPDYEVPISLNANQEIQCLTFDEAYECETYVGSYASEPCPVGYWLQKYNRITCKFHCKVDSRDGGECSNLETSGETTENQKDGTNGAKTGVWCYSEPDLESNANTYDERVCCRRRYPL